MGATVDQADVDGALISTSVGELTDDASHVEIRLGRSRRNRAEESRRARHEHQEQDAVARPLHLVAQRIEVDAFPRPREPDNRPYLSCGVVTNLLWFRVA